MQREVGPTVVRDLMESLENSYHVVLMDILFVMVELFSQYYEVGVYLTRTITRSNCIGLP